MEDVRFETTPYPNTKIQTQIVQWLRPPTIDNVRESKDQRQKTPEYPY